MSLGILKIPVKAVIALTFGNVLAISVKFNFKEIKFEDFKSFS